MHSKLTDAELFTKRFNKGMEAPKKPFDSHGTFVEKFNEEQLRSLRQAASNMPVIDPSPPPTETNALDEEIMDLFEPPAAEEDPSNQDPPPEQTTVPKEEFDSHSTHDSVPVPKGESKSHESQDPPPSAEENSMVKPEESSIQEELKQDVVMTDVVAEPTKKKPRLKKTCANCSKRYKRWTKCENCKNEFCKKRCFAVCRYCKLKKICVNCQPADDPCVCKSCKKKKKETEKFYDVEAEYSDEEEHKELMDEEIDYSDGFIVPDDECPPVDLADLHIKRRYDFENEPVHRVKGEKKRKTGKDESVMLNPRATSAVFTMDTIFDIIRDPESNWKYYQELHKSVSKDLKEKSFNFDDEDIKKNLQYILVLLLKMCIPDNRTELVRYIEENRLDTEIFEGITKRFDQHYRIFVDSISGQEKSANLVPLLDAIDKRSEFEYKETEVKKNGKYVCAITGRTLKKNERVYVVELNSAFKREISKAYFYVSRYSDKAIPEYYLSIFDFIFTNRWYRHRTIYRLKSWHEKTYTFPTTMHGKNKIQRFLNVSQLEHVKPILTEQCCFQIILRILSNFDTVIN